MAERKPARILFLTGQDGLLGEPLPGYLKNTRQLDLETRPTSRPPADLDDFRVLMLDNPVGFSPAEQDRLTSYVQRGGGCAGKPKLGLCPGGKREQHACPECLGPGSPRRQPSAGRDRWERGMPFIYYS